MEPLQHRGTMCWKMLFHAGAEAEVRPFRIDEDPEQVRVGEVCGQGLVEGGDHGAVDDVGLGPCQAQPKQPPALLQPDAERCRSRALTRRLRP